MAAGPGRAGDRRSYSRVGPGSSELQMRLSGLGQEPVPHGYFCRAWWLLSGSAWQKQTVGEERVNQQVCTRWRTWKGTQSRQRSLPPRSPPQPTAYCCSWPVCSERHKERQAAEGPALAYGSGADWLRQTLHYTVCTTATGITCVSCHLDSSFRIRAREDSSEIQLRGATSQAGAGDSWTTAVSGPHHQRKFENTPQHH